MWLKTPAGRFRVPTHEALRIQQMDDFELLKSLYVDGMVDPVALAEAQRRGIDGKPDYVCPRCGHPLSVCKC